MVQTIKNTLSAISLATTLFTAGPSQSAGSQAFDDAELPKLGALVITPSNNIRSVQEAKNPVVTEAIISFKEDIERIYVKNGLRENSIEVAINDTFSAIVRLCKALDPDFASKAFLELDPSERIVSANKILLKHDYIIYDLFFSADKQTSKSATVSLGLDKIVNRSTIDASNFSFESAGAKLNPFDKPVPLLEGLSVIKPLENRKNPPAVCIGFDEEFSEHLILLSRNRVSDFYPDYDPEKVETLNPAVNKFILDYALGRLAFVISSQKNSNIYPPAIRFNNRQIPLVNTLGMEFALTQNQKLSPELTTTVLSLAGVGINTAENHHLAVISSSLIDKMKEDFPQLTEIENPEDALRLFRQEPTIGEIFVEALTDSLKDQIKKIREAVKELERKKRELERRNVEKNTI